MGIDKINKRLHDAYGGQVRAEDKGDYIVVTGRLKEWKDIVAACGMCVQKGKKNRKKHVVNDIAFEGGSNPGMRMPGLRDSSLEGAAPDVLIIGGGISGADKSEIIPLAAGHPAGGKRGRSGSTVPDGMTARQSIRGI